LFSFQLNDRLGELNHIQQCYFETHMGVSQNGNYTTSRVPPRQKQRRRKLLEALRCGAMSVPAQAAAEQISRPYSRAEKTRASFMGLRNDNPDGSSVFIQANVMNDDG
jgi:hypothetical protein